jgi:hypothetical protein
MSQKKRIQRPGGAALSASATAERKESRPPTTLVTPRRPRIGEVIYRVELTVQKRSAHRKGKSPLFSIFFALRASADPFDPLAPPLSIRPGPSGQVSSPDRRSSRRGIRAGSEGDQRYHHALPMPFHRVVSRRVSCPSAALRPSRAEEREPEIVMAAITGNPARTG